VIISGTTGGSAYDTCVRLFAKHLGKYLPGNPSMAVQYRAGGGSIIARTLTGGFYLAALVVESK